MREVVLGVQPVPQPSPARNPGGDCFACALQACLGYLFPEKVPTFDEAWELFTHAKTTAGETMSNSWSGLSTALWYSRSKGGYPVDVMVDFVEPTFNPHLFSHPWYWHLPTLAAARRLEAWLSAGWVAFSEILFDGFGPFTPDLKFRSTDHIVLLDGVRYDWRETSLPGARSLVEMVHVVCSVKGAYWTELRDFQLRHGSAGWTLCRKEEE